MPVLANIEVIWVIIVIASVIAQIRKSIKKGGPPKREASLSEAQGQQPRKSGGSQDSREAYVEPDEALREFLQSLTGETVGARRPPPPQRRNMQGLRQPAARPSPRNPPPPPPAPARTIPVHKQVAPAVELKVLDSEDKKGNRTFAADIIRDLRSGKAARKAVIMREVLGSPVGLRSLEPH